MTLEGKEAGGGGMTDWPALERRKDCGEGRSMSADRWRKGGAVRPPVRSEGRRVFARRETEGSWVWVRAAVGRQDQRSTVGSTHKEPQHISRETVS